MIDKICPICSRKFQTINPRYKYCSDECRGKAEVLRKRKSALNYYRSTTGKIKRKQYYIQHHQPVIKHCKSCGKSLDDARQTWCIECLLVDYIYNKSAIAYQRLSCRGYDKAMILEEAKTRGLLKQKNISEKY